MSEIPNTKTYRTRIQNKIDTTENWGKAIGFEPLKGEIIIYADEGKPPKIKIGKGGVNVNALPFIDDDLVPNFRTINGKALNADIVLSFDDLSGTVSIEDLPISGEDFGVIKSSDIAVIENGVITKITKADKVANALTIGAKTYDGSTAVSISAADLGLSAAMKFLGTSTTAITDGATTNPITVGGTSTTVTAGNVVLYGSKEFVWNGSSWEELGNEGSYKVVQDAVSSPTTSGNATAFIDTISQDTNGKITATKKNVTFPTLSGGTSASADATVAGGVTVSGHAITVAKKTLTPGNNVQITGDATKITISATDTTYENATTTSDGLMSAADKTALNKVVSDMENIDYPVDSVNGKTGAVELTAEDVGAEVAGAVETHAEDTTIHTNATEHSNLVAAYAHANAKGIAKASGLYKITTNSEGHVTAASAVTKTDITELGIPAQDTVYTLPAAGTDLGGVKSGGDVSISNGIITVNNDSHTHSVENITGLEDRLSEIEGNLTFPVTSVNTKTGDVVLTAADVGADAAGAASTALTNAKSYTDSAVGGKVDKVSGKGLSTNDYTTAEKTKLANISEGAEVNQNAFSNIVVGSTTIAADSKTDTLTLVAGANIALTPDASGDKITITGASHENTTYSAGTGLEMDGTTINHSNSVTAKTTYNQATAAPGYGGTFKITEPKYDAQGHITGTQVATITMPSAQTIPTSLKNPNALTVGSKTYDGSSAITIEASDLGLSNALHFIGVKASLPLTGNTNGDVVLVGNKEYVYSDGWVELGDGDSHALKTVQVKAGDGLAGGGAISGDVTLSHAHTSSVSNVTANGRTYVTGLTFDTYGHVTGVTTGTETVENTDTNTTYDLAASVSSSDGNVKLNLTAGGSGSGTDSVTIKGGGATTVTTDANGVVTISSTDNNTVYTHPAGNAASKASGFYKFSTDANSHINDVTAVTKDDIVAALGYTPPETAGSATDEKVLQTRTSVSSYRPLLLHSLYADYETDPGSATDTIYYNETISAKASTGELKATKVYGAVWNDYAEYRKAEEIEAGRVVVESKDGVMKMANKRLLPACEIVSDTFGFGIGETDECKTPIACSGRVLAYTYEDKDEFELGDAVCSGPNGTVSRMTREEIREYPERIIGTVSEIPTYEVWGSGNVKVNGRIWIRIR